MRLIHGDCLDVLRGLPDASVDAVVTDPPYGLGFMGKEWDSPGALVERKADRSQKWDKAGGNHNPSNSADQARTRRVEGQKFQHWCEGWTREVLRVLKPGGHLLAFGGTRTYHRMTCAIEDAGFEVRDCLMWLYGTGFPKSLDVSKAIDKAAGAEHLRTFKCKNPADRPYTHTAGETSTGWQSPPRPDKTNPATESAKRWSGWGTALKPANEPIVLARKPLVGTVAANVQAHGTGALNIDGCRIATNDNLNGGAYAAASDKNAADASSFALGVTGREFVQPPGRWPANALFDEDAAAELDAQSGVSKSTGGVNAGGLGKNVYGKFSGEKAGASAGGFGDSGGASRFFYVAKPSKRERGTGNVHPTVKPVALMRYLCRLVTPPGGTVLDPFMGSGTTGVAALAEGFDFIGIEREPEYLAIAERRIAASTERPEAA